MSKETMYNGKYILWDIVDVYEKLKGNWQIVGLEGYDEDGSYYTAAMETFISNPIFREGAIFDIELQEEHKDIKIDEMFTEFELKIYPYTQLILRESRAKAISLSSLLKDLNTLKNKVKELTNKTYQS